jgi:hypothetical protein
MRVETLTIPSLAEITYVANMSQRDRLNCHGWVHQPLQSLSPKEVHSIQCGVRLGTCTLGPSNRVTHQLGTSYKQQLSWAIASIHIHAKS